LPAGRLSARGARQKAANAQRADQGKPPSTRAYGYTPDGTVIPEEAEVVRTMFEKFSAGATLMSIRTALNREGVLNSRRRPWGPTGVRGILLNPRYIGECWRNGDYVGPGSWEPLVAADTFAAAGARLRDPIRLRGHEGSARKHLGGGLYRCGICGDGTLMKSAQSRYTLADGGVCKFRAYLCATSKHLHRKAEPIDAVVAAVIAERLRGADVLAMMADDQTWPPSVHCAVRRTVCGLAVTHWPPSWPMASSPPGRCMLQARASRQGSSTWRRS